MMKMKMNKMETLKKEIVMKRMNRMMRSKKKSLSLLLRMWMITMNKILKKINSILMWVILMPIGYKRS